MRVFADSFYYFALSNPTDEAHSAAYEFAAGYSGEIVTTAWVLTEVADGFSAPQWRTLFPRLLSQIQRDAKTLLVLPSTELWIAGVQLYSERADKQWSLTDCISFTVMRAEGLHEALTGDHHFTQAGFKAMFA